MRRRRTTCSVWRNKQDSVAVTSHHPCSTHRSFLSFLNLYVLGKVSRKFQSPQGRLFEAPMSRLKLSRGKKRSLQGMVSGSARLKPSKVYRFLC